MIYTIITVGIVMVSIHAALTVHEMRHLYRNHETKMRDMAVRHARERAALTAWRIEVEHHLRERGLQ